MPQEISKLAQDVKDDCFVAVRELLQCAKAQQCRTPEEAKGTMRFLHIVESLLKDINYNRDALVQAQALLQGLLQSNQSDTWEEL